MTLSLGPARLAALETDDSAHSLNWLTHGASSAGPGRVSSRGPGPGRAESSTERRVSRRYSRLQVRVKAYTRAGPGLTGTILIWVRAAMAERRAGGSDGTDWGTCLSLCQPSLQSDSENPSLIHPSELGPRLRLRWTMAPEGWGQGEDWLSTLTIGDSDGRREVRGPDTF